MIHSPITLSWPSFLHPGSGTMLAKVVGRVLFEHRACVEAIPGITRITAVFKDLATSFKKRMLLFDQSDDQTSARKRITCSKTLQKPIRSLVYIIRTF